MRARVIQKKSKGAARLWQPYFFTLIIWFFLARLSMGSPSSLPLPAGYQADSETRSQPSSTSAKFQQAMGAARQKMKKQDFAGAIPLLEEAVRLNPKKSDAKQLLLEARFEQEYQEGSRYLAKGDLTRAQSSLKRAFNLASTPGMEAQAGRAKAQLSLAEGERLMQSRSYEAAAKDFQMALVFSPNDSIALAGLSEARFHAAYQSGRTALAQGSFDRARDKFRECLGYKPGDTQALEQMERVNEVESVTGQFQSSYQAANTLLDQGAWEQADIEIKRLADIMLKAERMGFHARAIFQPRPLLPAFETYAVGDLDGALRLAQVSTLNADPARAAKFHRFLERKRRLYYLHAWAPFLLGGYLFILVGSLYAGLKQALTAPRPVEA
jgi:tetratricopeptide (TPR) repeat protein